MSEEKRKTNSFEETCDDDREEKEPAKKMKK
jgi:hypothetical protein